MLQETIEEKLALAIKILNYCIQDKKTITEGCAKFKTHEAFLRKVKAKITQTKSASPSESKTRVDFLSLYNQYVTGRFQHVQDEQDNLLDELDKDLLSGDNIVNGESAKTSETDNGIEVDYRGNAIIKTADQLLKEANVDLTFWKLDREVVNKWDVTMKGADDLPIKSQNFQVKLWLSKKAEAIETFNAAETFKQLLAEIPTPSFKKVNYNNNTNSENNLLEINIFDLHIGKLCWAGETGENYDVKIASRRFLDALTKLLQRGDAFTFNKILFPVGNDFFNVDTLQNTTTEGTPQDEDLRWQKTFKLGFELLVQGIELMRQYAPVDVVLIPGNHDYMKNYFLGHSLLSWYRNCDDVQINNHSSPRKYYQHGEVLLGLTHGNNEKEALLPMLMMREQKHLMAQTSFHEWHLGHFHKKKTVKYKVLDEELGVIVRYLASLSGTDSWHHRKGYVGGNKAAEAFLWNDTTGFVAQFNVNINVKDVDSDVESESIFMRK